MWIESRGDTIFDCRQLARRCLAETDACVDATNGGASRSAEHVYGSVECVSQSVSIDEGSFSTKGGVTVQPLQNPCPSGVAIQPFSL